MKILLTFLLLIFTFQISFAQELKEGEYWYSEISKYKAEIWEYKKFTKDDVIKAQQKLALIKQSKTNNEWEGVYLSNYDGLGEVVLLWNSENGFVSYYFYHTLKILKYGNVINKNNVINFQYQNSSVINKNKPKLLETIVKVKVGDSHYLVPENSIKAFLEDWVGVFPKHIPPYFYSFWYKIVNKENEVPGNPIIPLQYEHLRRSPIETKIDKIGKRKIYQEKYDGAVVNEEIHYFVTLRDGRNKRIKVGMDFFVADLGEWIEITKVNQNSSVGKIRRSYYDKVEECWDDRGGNGDSTPCKKFKIGMSAKTVSPFK